MFLVAVTVSGGEVILSEPFQTQQNLKGWRLAPGAGVAVAPDGKNALKITCGDTTGKSIFTCGYRFDPKTVAGRRLTATVEVMRDLTPPSVKWQGGKFQFSIKTPGKQDWKGVYMANPQSSGWEKLTLTADIPLDAEAVSLDLGIQNASGTIWFRNLSVEAGDLILRLDSQANMGFRDAVPRDGKGGWSDQGPQNDAANFQFRSKTFGNVPFGIADPGSNGGKAIAVFQSSQLPAGLAEVKFDLSQAAVKGGNLYLLHTLTFGHGFKGVAGTVELIGKNGKTATLPVRGDKDVADWWAPSRKENAFPASLWQNASGGMVGLYVSKFNIPEEVGELAAIRLRPEDPRVLWILAGATLSQNDYPAPAGKQHTVRENAVWKPLPIPEKPGVIPGSALDLSRVLDQPPVGALGRLVIGENGNFVFAKQPDKPVRFLAAAYLRGLFSEAHGYPAELPVKEAADDFVRQLRMQGFNMIRFHYLDSTMLEKSDADFKLNPDILDRFDYLIAKMKEAGIYANIDVMASRIGWSHGYSWEAKPGDQRNFKLDIHFQPEVRENWKTGFRTLLTHVNPYTGTRLLDDPVLAIAVAYNEQEFGWGRENFGQAADAWRAFLKHRYGTIDALKNAWGEPAAGYADFNEIAPFSVAQIAENSPRGADLARFIAEREDELAKWYQETAHELGFKGYLASYTMAQSLRNTISRRNSEFIALNTYHSHPFNNVIDTAGAIERKARYVRALFSVRQSGKPLVATELGHAFWNPYRYEEGMVAGAYAAFQGIDGLTPFAESVTAQPSERPITTFALRNDAILKSQEFLMALLFRRGDVKTAGSMMRVRIDPEAVFAGNMYSDALNSDQAMLSLVTGFATEIGENAKPPADGVVIPAAGGSALLIRSVGGAGYTQAQESKTKVFDFNDTLGQLKKAGQVPPGNRTDHAKGVYESSTGEIYLDSPKHFMSVNTPRFQGICGEAGATAKLKDFEVKKLGSRGGLSLVSLENGKSLADSGRMVLVFATNLLNSGMVFEDDTYRTCLKKGELPLLLETGVFRAALNNRNAEKLKLYALGLDGKRIAELPLVKSPGRIEFEVDTAKIPNGPAIYFELAAD